ncbi:MAG: hypothetical protein LBO81_03960 [Clostridiales Family XIII bacterium]|nr:hypothetical protein [Clostridiales Family XIII bacterium]
MTLVEIIVTFLVAAILIAASSALIISGTNLVAHTTNRAMDEAVADAALKLTSRRLLYASAVSVVEPGDPKDFNAALTENKTVVYTGDESGNAALDGKGMLWFKRFDAEAEAKINIFGVSFYHGRRIALQYKVDRVRENMPKAVTVTVLVYNREGERTLTKSTTVQLLNAQTTDVSTMQPPLVDDAGKLYYDPPDEALILAITEAE